MGRFLKGTTDETKIPVIPTRAARDRDGLVSWYFLNCNGQKDVIISGNGAIDGQGEYWWRKYWEMTEERNARRIR